MRKYLFSALVALFGVFLFGFGHDMMSEECMYNSDCGDSGFYCENGGCVERTIEIEKYSGGLKITVKGSITSGLLAPTREDDVSVILLATDKYGWDVEAMKDKFSLPFTGDNKEYVFRYPINEGDDFRGALSVLLKNGRVVWFLLQNWQCEGAEGKNCIADDYTGGKVLYF